MKKLYLHIGPHKTGSTYIQKTFFENREKLASAGLLYPDENIGPQWGHHQLVEQIKGREEARINKFLSDLTQDTIISSENLTYLGPDEIAFFGGFCTDFDVEVIYFKRGLAELLLSYWQEVVKHGSSVSYPKFVLRHVGNPFASGILNGVATLNKWKTVFGDKSPTIVDFDKIASDGADICDVLLHQVLGLDLSFGAGEKINVSMNFVDVEIIRVLNALVSATGKPVTTNVREAFLGLKRQGDSRVRKLFDAIGDDLEDFSVEGLWSVDHMEEHFSIFFPYREDGLTLQPAPRNYRLPSDVVLLRPEVSKLINCIAQEIIEKL